MANLTETTDYPAGIYQIEMTDPVLGGAPNEGTMAGLSNIPHQQLARRTAWLKGRVDALTARTVATAPGSGLSGGGSLSADRSLSVDATVLRTAGGQTVTGRADFAARVNVSGGTGQNDVTLAFGDPGIGLYRAGDQLRIATGATARVVIDSAGLTLGAGGAYAGDGSGLTLAGSAEFARSLDVSGYQRLPGGLILQWGQVMATDGALVLFPVSFPTACRSLTLTDHEPAARNLLAMSALSAGGFTLRFATTSGVAIASSNLIYFSAIGY